MTCPDCHIVMDTVEPETINVDIYNCPKCGENFYYEISCRRD